MVGRSGRGVLLAVGAAWALAAGCAHGRGASGASAPSPRADDPSPDAAKACAGLDPFALGPFDITADGQKPPPDHTVARAKAFYCLGLYAVAVDLFKEAIGSTSVEWAIRDASASGEPPPLPDHRAPALRWLVYVHRRFPGWERIGGAVGEVRRGDLRSPELADVHDELHLLAGRWAYERGRFDDAVELLRTIPASSAVRVEAALLEGVVHVRAGAPPLALSAFGEALRSTPARGGPNDARNRDLAVVSVARVYYALGQFEAARRQYDLLAPTSSYWSAAALEGGWISIQLKDHPRALAQVRALQARSRELSFEALAEAAMLEATIALEEHRTDDLTRILLQFNDIYPAVYDQARRLSRQQPEALYQLAYSVRAGGALPLPVGAEPARLLLADVRVAGSFDEVAELDWEIALLATLPTKWRVTQEGQYVRDALERRRQAAAEQTGGLVQRRLQRLADDLAAQIKRSIGMEVQSRYEARPWRGPLD